MTAKDFGTTTIDTFYFLGIGGIGMSALARYFAEQGCRVYGYDRTPSPLTQALEREGIGVQYDDSVRIAATLDPQTTLVVRTPAVPEDEPVCQYLRDRHFAILKRAELLGRVTRRKKALCVAGTHGKTTTSAILAHILHPSHEGASAFLGGIANNYATNLLTDDKSDWVVVEADEYDRSFLQLTPYMSVITSADPDHLDIYGTAAAYREGFVEYAARIQHALVVKKQVSDAIPALKTAGAKQVFTYAADEKADYYADNIQETDGKILFDFHTPDSVLHAVKPGVPVWVNIENSVAAMAMASLAGATAEELRRGVESFSGVYRRFNRHVQTPEIAYIDDYAHHPAELEASIGSVRRLYPNRYAIGVFQPHLYSRTRDFADDFARALSRLDEVVLLPVYPARELPIAGVTSELLLGKIHCGKTLVAKEDTAAWLRRRVQDLTGKGQACVVMTLGAGDIGCLTQDITRALTL